MYYYLLITAYFASLLMGVGQLVGFVLRLGFYLLVSWFANFFVGLLVCVWVSLCLL